MEWVLLWVVMAFVVALIGASKHGAAMGFAWFVYGLFIWPIALAHALVIGRTADVERRRAEEAGRRACPHCAEMILPAARVCPHCRNDLAEGWAEPGGPRPARPDTGFLG